MAEMTFEKALLELETITEKLESGELPLDESMKLYQQGVKLSDFCSKQLDAAQLQISQLDDIVDAESGE